ncbi:PilX N-terminal domain-containing pilus assembly protein [Ralstonia solanacearum]|uniref:pilus assembly PilX family protein n=1 Tax=Ralstonia solanacearum TaxID=305 RepID=UPI0012A06D80|nr:pilus assembly PilX N-terminal domain-containing protein [Ralstonia solanacearum]AYB59809.1 pilus assembly protein [Ralstonia solanacearum]
MRRLSTRQSGVTLVVSLIFLAIFMAIVVVMTNSSVINSKIAANQQYGMEARSAAQQGIEQVISVDFTSSPAAASVPVDVNGDGKTDYTAQVAVPVCKTTKPILNIELNASNADDASCYAGNGNQDTGVIGSGSTGGHSNCDATQWDVAATVSDASATSVNTTLHQGVAVRVPSGTVCP